jgi:hypothetical protein
MNFTRRDRRLFLALALVGVAVPFVGLAVDGSIPSPRLWFPLLALGVFGAQFGRPWRRPASKTDLDNYRKWRTETELTEEERGVRLPGELGAALEPSSAAPPRERPRKPTFDERRYAFAASAGRGFFVKAALWSTAATVLCFSVLPYAIIAHDYGAGIIGAALLLIAPLCAWVALSTWWYVWRGRFLPALRSRHADNNS